MSTRETVKRIVLLLLVAAVIAFLAWEAVLTNKAVRGELYDRMLDTAERLQQKVSRYEDQQQLMSALAADNLVQIHRSAPHNWLANIAVNDEGNQYSLRETVSQRNIPVMLAGAGEFGNRSQAFYDELSMALELTPVMVQLFLSLPGVEKVFYFSRDEFVYSLPSDNAESVPYLQENMLQAFYELARPYQNPDRTLFWTQASLRDEQSRLTATMIHPVYARQSLRGLLAMDINILELIEKLPGQINGAGTLLLVDSGNQVLSAPGKGHSPRGLSFENSLPAEVSGFISHPFDIPAGGLTVIRDYSITRSDMLGPGWHLVFVIPDHDINRMILGQLVPELIAAVLFLAFVAMLARQNLTRLSLKRSRSQLSAQFAHASAAQLIVDDSGEKIVRANKAAAELFGFPLQKLRDIPLSNLIVGMASAQELSNSLSEQGIVVVKCRTADGKEKDLEIFNSVISNTEQTHFHLILHDVTERIRKEEHVRFQAYFDPLTRLPNRNHLFEHLRQLIAAHRREDHSLALLFIDLDRFKQVNDNLGHNIGDRVLQSVAERLKDRLRESDMLARLGGDEFTVVLPHLRDELDASHVAKTLINQLHEPFTIDSYEIVLGASIGITLYPRDGRDPSALLKNADIAMYRAKDNGRNQYRFFEDQMNREAKHRITLENDIRRAVSNDELRLALQPVVTPETEKVVGVEMLIRWEHPQLGQLKPDEFIHIAEETGEITAIGDWVLHRSYEIFKQVSAEVVSSRIPFFCINLSRRQLMHEGHVRRWRDILQNDRQFADFILLDMTEYTLNSQIWDERIGLNSLLSLGPRICLDDFGQDHSSLRVLRQYPISMIKLDRGLISKILSSDTDAAFCKAVISLARNLNIRVVAEGVETSEQLQWLQSAQCNYLQGHLVGREITVEALIETLK